MTMFKGGIYLVNALSLAVWLVMRDASAVQYLNLLGAFALGAWIVRPNL